MDLRQVIISIRPSKDEDALTKKIANDVICRLRKASKLEVVLVGSIAKGTALSGEGDIDVFVILKKKMEKNKIKEKIESIFKKAFPHLQYQMNYAEHPYIKFHYCSKKIDVVPAYKMSVDKKLITAVDRSVLHTKYIIKNLFEKQKDEVRLLKKFLKTNGIYGAEIRVEGFSGYLCELLIIYYGSFLRLLRNAAKWKFPVVIDLKKHYKKNEYADLVKKFNKDFIVIDPTDKNRNVAAPLNSENLKKFVHLARSFLKNPSQRYFSEEVSFEKKLRTAKRKNIIVLIYFSKPEIVDDVLWGQIKKLLSTIKNSLSAYGISKILVDASSTIRIAVLARKKEIGGKIEIKGPPLSLSEHVARFKKAHRGSKLKKKNHHIFAIVKIKKKNIFEALQELLETNKNRFSHLPLSKAKLEFF